MTPGLSGDEFCDYSHNIRTYDEFAEFVIQLLINLRDHPEEWDNLTLPEYLQGLAGFVQGLEGYYKSRGEEVDLERPVWQVFADILRAARVYE